MHGVPLLGIGRRKRMPHNPKMTFRTPWGEAAGVTCKAPLRAAYFYINPSVVELVQIEKRPSAVPKEIRVKRIAISIVTNNLHKKGK